VHPPETLPTSEFKSRRVVDRRAQHEPLTATRRER
jgi:hypothetical protein